MSTCHALGLIYMVFALATLFDPNAAAYSVESREWYLLSRICLRCAPPLYDTTLYAIQCMVRSITYFPRVAPITDSNSPPILWI